MSDLSSDDGSSASVRAAVARRKGHWVGTGVPYGGNRPGRMDYAKALTPDYHRVSPASDRVDRRSCLMAPVGESLATSPDRIERCLPHGEMWRTYGGNARTTGRGGNPEVALSPRIAIRSMRPSRTGEGRRIDVSART